MFLNSQWIETKFTCPTFLIPLNYIINTVNNLYIFLQEYPDKNWTGHRCIPCILLRVGVSGAVTSLDRNKTK